MKRIVALRFIVLGLLFGVTVCLAVLFFALRVQKWQARLLDEPDYFPLLAQTVAENIYDKSREPTAVFRDEEMAGCNMRRNNLVLLPFPQPPVGSQRSHPSSQPVWEIRYSTQASSLGILKTLENNQYFGGPGFSMGYPIGFPNSAEFMLGEFNPAATRQIKDVDYWDLKGVDLKTFADGGGGLVASELANRYPGWGISDVQSRFKRLVRSHYEESSGEVRWYLGWFMVIVGLLGILFLDILYDKWKVYASNEVCVTWANCLKGAEKVAVSTAGKTSFLGFCLRYDIAAYQETIWQQQSEAVLAIVEIKAILRGLPRELIEAGVAAGTVSSLPPKNGHRPRVTLREVSYPAPRKQTREPELIRKDGLLAAQQAIKVVAEIKSLSDFAFPKEVLLEDMNDRDIFIATEIVKTLLAGWGGGACIGERRMLQQQLRNRVFAHKSAIASKPRAYDGVLAWLTREGVLSFCNEKGGTYSIVSHFQSGTEAGRRMRLFIIKEYQHRRGMM